MRRNFTIINWRALDTQRITFADETNTARTHTHTERDSVTDAERHNAFTARLATAKVKIAYNADVHFLCVPNLLGSGTYNKGVQLSVKFSFMTLGNKTSEFCDVTP